MIVRGSILDCALALVLRSLFVKLMSIVVLLHSVLNLKCYVKVTQIRPNALIVCHCITMYWCSVQFISCKIALELQTANVGRMCTFTYATIIDKKF